MRDYSFFGPGAESTQAKSGSSPGRHEAKGMAAVCATEWAMGVVDLTDSLREDPMLWTHWFEDFPSVGGTFVIPSMEYDGDFDIVIEGDKGGDFGECGCRAQLCI